MRQTEGLPTPKEYRLWTAISTIAGVLERKTWTSASGGAFYPNLYTVLVGGPGTGKSVGVTAARSLWSKVKDLNLAPDSVSKASLIKDLAHAVKTVSFADGSIKIYSSLAIACREFNTLFPNYDRDFCAAMNDIFDNPPEYKSTRIYSGETIIQSPNLNMLAAVTPDTLYDTLPDPAWGSGFTARLILIYGFEKPDVDFFDDSNDGSENIFRSIMLPGLNEISKLNGKFVWSNEAKDGVRKWRAEGLAPVPEHSKLTHYLTRRESHVIKLAMISGVSSTGTLNVGLSDFERAKNWLLTAETRMPDIFKAMGQKSDSQLIKDLHLQIYQLWASVEREKRKPIKNAKVMEFLVERVPSERVEKIIDIAEKLGVIRRAQNGVDWEPRPMGTF